jgi:hypothetical protein
MFIKDFPTTNGFIFSVRGYETYPVESNKKNILNYITVNKRGGEYIIGLTRGVFGKSIKEDEDPHSKEHTCEPLPYIQLTTDEMIEFNKKLNELILK